MSVNTKILYGVLRTNRHTLVKYIALFRQLKVDGEALVSPRPLPGSFGGTYGSYHAFVSLVEGSPMEKRTSELRGFLPIDEEAYAKGSGAVRFAWRA